MLWEKIRENITPRGDGNNGICSVQMLWEKIRENITPRGDGNLGKNKPLNHSENHMIRENITPRGDGNF